MQKIFYSINLLLLVGMLYFGELAYKNAKIYEQQTSRLVDYQGAQSRAIQQLETFAKTILGEYYDQTHIRSIEKIQVQQTLARHEAQKYTRYFMILLMVLMGSYFLIHLQAFTFFGSLAASVALLFGLLSPILMVTIHKEVEYLGDIVLSFESKGIIGSIAKLWEGGDYVVAGVILLFSVCTPLLKIVSLLFISIFQEYKFAKQIVWFFKRIGKWSMVDVFVVAVFLVYLTANKAKVSHAEVEVGLYFFLAYVIVSMLVSFSAERMLQSKKKSLDD